MTLFLCVADFRERTVVRGVVASVKCGAQVTGYGYNTLSMRRGSYWRGSALLNDVANQEGSREEVSDC